jgi:hypothetical protein
LFVFSGLKIVAFLAAVVNERRIDAKSRKTVKPVTFFLDFRMAPDGKILPNAPEYQVIKSAG